MSSENDRALLPASPPPKLSASLIDPVEDPGWDKFVESHPFGRICHLSGWKQVLENSFKHMKGYYFVLVDENDNIKAGLPIHEVKSWLIGNRLVSIPFATLCDPLVSSKDEMQHLIKAALDLFKQTHSDYIEIRSLSSAPLMQDNLSLGLSIKFL